MKTKQLATTLLATSMFVGISVTANAKTKSVKLNLNKVTENSTYFSGKTTPKANVKVTRYGITYAKGKASTKGTFKLKSNDNLSGNWHYRVTSSKKGYKTVKKYVLVKKVTSSKGTTTTKYVDNYIYQNDQNQINALNDQITALQNQIKSIQSQPSTNTTNTVYQTDNSQVDNLKKLITDLQTQVNNLKNSSNTNSGNSDNTSGNAGGTTNKNQAKIDEVNKKIDELSKKGADLSNQYLQISSQINPLYTSINQRTTEYIRYGSYIAAKTPSATNKNPHDTVQGNQDYLSTINNKIAETKTAINNSTNTDEKAKLNATLASLNQQLDSAQFNVDQDKKMMKDVAPNPDSFAQKTAEMQKQLDDLKAQLATIEKQQTENNNLLNSAYSEKNALYNL